MDAIQWEVDRVRLWADLQGEAEALQTREPSLAQVLRRSVCEHPSLEAALAHRLAHKLGCAEVSAAGLREVFADTLSRMPAMVAAAWADLLAVSTRDPACTSALTPLLHFSGYLALQSYRIAHGLWHEDRRQLALHLQSRSSQVFGVDIHPAARIGKNVMIDHAISVVVGETAVIEDDVSMLHEVTLGGRGGDTGDRHPKVRRGVMLGAGAKILGNVELGAYCRVGAGSVVLADVPPFCTVAGVPARIVCTPEKHADPLNFARSDASRCAR